jgi:hypothetical protein
MALAHTRRLENGASPVVSNRRSFGIPPANAVNEPPSLSHSKLSAQGAGIVAVGWAAACQNVQRADLLTGCNIGVIRREDSITHRV